MGVRKYSDPLMEKLAKRRAKEQKEANKWKREMNKLEAKRKREEKERLKKEKEQQKFEAYKKQEKARLKNMEKQEKERHNLAQKNIKHQKQKVKRLSGCCLIPSLIFTVLIALFIVFLL